MNNTSLDFNIIKMQLKARIRVPTLMKSKRLNLEFDRVFKSSPKNDLNLESYTQKNMNKQYIDSFVNYSSKINLLKKLLSNISIKELYHEEKLCSSRCKEILDEIDTKKSSFDFTNLPPILNNNNKLKKRKLIIKKLSLKPKLVKNLGFKNYMKMDYLNTPYLSSSNKITSMETTKEKDKDSEKKLLKSKSIIDFHPKNLFKCRQNFSIIKYGGIKYNNSIYRFKNMNDLLHFKV